MENNVMDYFSGELYKEMIEAIIYFLSSFEIREGKFEGNEILINKLNRETAIIYKEYQLDNGSYEYSRESIICNIPKLLEEIKLLNY